MANEPLVSHGRGGENPFYAPLLLHSLSHPLTPQLPLKNSSEKANIPTGAANISRDDTPYTDGEIVREGLVGDQGDGAFSTGVSPSFLFP
jgi:hypothetical protein